MEPSNQDNGFLFLRCRQSQKQSGHPYFGTCYQSIQVPHQKSSATVLLRRNKRACAEETLPSKSRIVQLSPFIDDHGFLRSRGRLGKASIIICSRYPVFLGAESPSIDLYLKHVHDTNGHCGLKFSRALTQQQFWTLKARKALRQIIRHCITCRRQQQDVIQPIIADLPEERLPSTINFPFRTPRIDYLGPFFIKIPRAKKRYVLFFTCLVTRAVHVVVTAQLNTDDTILALRRLICRRGQPQSIRSDNATTFVSAIKDLNAALNKHELASPDISGRLGLQHIAWYFNPPLILGAHGSR